ncbi:heme exporter protein CcmD [Vannielia litorea]|uniref:Heme exporter protein D n=1 Tax=Vannielia litorea TaxID=1217970 RepID=A0A1N6FMJ8_9RHOB|nr:heme exporter protein CcmD [Vannielia litorea]SIN96468.1 heme exporter protein D [Vannielia litorea]
MPELGKYAAEVLLAYAGSIAILAGLLWLSLRRGAQVRERLRRMEEERK